MVCSCCAAAIPQAALSLFLTAAAVNFTFRAVLPNSGLNRSLLRVISVLTSTVLVALGVLLSILHFSAPLRGLFFVNLCTVLSKPGPLDAFRCPLVGSASGNVLEVGPGAGANFRCFVNATTHIDSYTTVEPNKDFTSVLLSEAASQNLSFEITPTWLRGEEINVLDASMDAVIGTHMLCSVDDPQQVLLNIDKSLKVGGFYYSMEHVSASPQDRPVLSLSQDLLSPFFKIIADGCTFRDAEAEIFSALGDRYEIEINRFDAPMPLAAFKPHVSIVAKKLKESCLT
ncbi:hypothetical protein TrVE_jg8531 [Triparma verrucosa]|uniref:Methyltransferase type 11 domain-containing protein n=1 Tax=Triparma verrucosa TaxID=1606542 RepID=A0A9W7KU21_9STRA|nr:hypothetical protein TrVE_jg8531 [Triparma verrucosa]